MKKFLSIALALVLVFCMTVSVYAATTDSVTDVPGSKSQDVKVNISEDDVNKGKVYKVDIEWSDMQFTYSFTQGEPVWDPDDHDYLEQGTDAESGNVITGWDKTAATIVVKNHSNAAVEVSAAFANDASEKTTSGVTAAITSENTFTGTLASAENTDVNDPPKTTFTVTITGVPEVTEDFTVGTITVSIGVH